jgi:uncharacterized protein (DUF58 family)
VKIRPVVYIVPLALLAVTLAVGSPLLYRVFVLLLALGLAAFLWTWLGLKGLSVSSSIPPASCQVGDSFREDITVANEGRMPRLIVKAEEKTDLPEYRNVAMLNIPAAGARTLTSTVNLRRRGRYTLGALSLTTGDPFGLFTHTRVAGDAAQVIVYPQVVDLPLFLTSSSSLIDFGRGAASRRISQISPSASSVRDMMSGDSQEHIHWRSTAHAGKLMVKVFDAEHSGDTTKNVWIVLDMEREPQAGEGSDSTEECSVSVAASLAKRYLDDGMKVGLVASAEKEYSIPPNDGAAHFGKIMDALTFMKAEGRIPVNDLAKEVERYTSLSTVVLVTPRSTEPVLNSLRMLRTYGHAVTGVFVDSASFGGVLDPAHMAHALGAMGAQVYVVRKGDNLGKALDSRSSLWYSRYL